MTMVSFSDGDMRRGIIVEPAWYTLKITGHRTWTPTKDGQSNNCFMDCVIEKNAETGSTDFAGVEVQLMFNDKPTAKGFIMGFLQGMGVDIQADARYNLESAVGQRIDAFVENNEYQGRISNRVNHKYRVVRD